MGQNAAVHSQDELRVSIWNEFQRTGYYIVYTQEMLAEGDVFSGEELRRAIPDMMSVHYAVRGATTLEAWFEQQNRILKGRSVVMPPRFWTYNFYAVTPLD